MPLFAVVREDRRQDYGEDREILLGMAQDRLLAVSHAPARRASADHLGPISRTKGTTTLPMKRTAKDKPKIDWSRVDAMTEAERHAAAMADPELAR